MFAKSLLEKRAEGNAFGAVQTSNRLGVHWTQHSVYLFIDLIILPCEQRPLSRKIEGPLLAR